MPVVRVCDGDGAMGMGMGERLSESIFFPSQSRRTLIFRVRLCRWNRSFLPRWWYKNPGVASISIYIYIPTPTPPSPENIRHLLSRSSSGSFFFSGDKNPITTAAVETPSIHRQQPVRRCGGDAHGDRGGLRMQLVAPCF